MSKVVNLRNTVYELYKEDPAILEVMKDLGFHDIDSPGMLNSVGRFMTIPKGAKMKKISMDKVKEVFNSKGYEVIE